MKLICLWLVACAWTGCAAKGGAKPWEGIFSSRALKGHDAGGQGASEEATQATEGPWETDSDFDALQQGFWQEGPQEGSWPETELDQPWRRALRKSPILELEGLYHPLVQSMAQDYRFTGGSSGRRPISQSSQYIPRMKEIFREEGLPEELVYLAFVESGFNPWASSSGRCVGMWQFTEATGRRYGLRIDNWVDERRDPEKSTRAAARHLRDLYQTFRSWDLAIAAYNAGEKAILDSLAKKEEASSFWDLYPSGRLSKATREFVPKVMAAILVANEEQASFQQPDQEDQLWRFDKLRIQEHLDLSTVARLAGCSEKELRALNPQLKGSVLHPGASGLDIRVPEGKGEELSSLLSERGRMVRPPKADQGDPTGFRTHKVRPGDTLGLIAKQYGTSEEELRSWNRLRSGSMLRPGIDLLVPEGKSNSVSWKKTHKVGVPGKSAESEAVQYHQVRKGETLWSIARHYGVSVEALMRWNDLSGPLLKPGITLRLNP